MPSIRVRRTPSYYESLRNDLNDPAAFVRSQSASEGYPFLDEQDTVRQSRRARTSTYADPAQIQRISRVSAHIANDNTWGPGDMILTENGMRHVPFNSSRQNRYLHPNQYSGSQSGVQRQPSVALSFRSRSDQFVDGSEDHDEAVVDHLDVIGKENSQLFYLLLDFVHSRSAHFYRF
jgi:hypothetical protein